ncbi:MAG: hypothetical protein C5S38_07535 [Candidatus Methanophagaceae archaeon]|nr:MAG: hypothetical protein C5S38_07535 [Methanophagales archaeon]KAF5433993.1 hypothetical protein C5S36_05785 [Methanophagales archaeon]
MIGKISYIMKRTGDNTKFAYKELYSINFEFPFLKIRDSSPLGT